MENRYLLLLFWNINFTKKTNIMETYLVICSNFFAYALIKSYLNVKAFPIGSDADYKIMELPTTLTDAAAHWLGKELWVIVSPNQLVCWMKSWKNPV